MEAAVAGIGKAALNCLLSGAKAAITEDAALRQSVQRDVVFLTDELAAMKSYLRDADEERNRHKVTQSRVKHVRDLAYDVEDCLAEFAVHLEKPSGWRLARTVLERHRIAEEMKGLRARAEEMNHRNLRYHLPEDPCSSKLPASSSYTENPSTLDLGLGTGAKRQVDLFFESGQLDLVPLICKKDQDLRVIAVWGASGDPRKTSVIRRAYDDLKRKDNEEVFESYAWVRVMHPFNPSEFLQCIVRQLYMNSLEKTGMTKAQETLGSQVHKEMEKMHHLVDEFNKHVSQKRYLIVLNELSTIEDWDWVKTYFPNNKKGSRIIVSTEQAEVASLCAGPERLVVELKQSSTDQTIYAFCEKGTMELEPRSKSAAADTGPEMMEGAPKESQFLWRQNEIQRIINKLMSKDDGQEPKVFSICGKGGIGKSSLVKYIYQNEDLRSKFNKHAYVTIKHPFNLTDLLDSLTKQLGGGSKTPRDRRQCLDEPLKDKKYLIVLDDLSSKEDWEIISKHIPQEGKSTSRIIVTTSMENIAMHWSKKDTNIHKLESLDENNALNLFTQTVFHKIIDWNRQEYRELAEEAKSLVSKCKGFPLALLTIGGVLAKRPHTLVEWRKLNEYIGPESATNSEVEIIRTILVKCYNCLPYDLKSCFLYLSIFPEDHIVSRRRLVHRWTAEGYTSNNKHGKSAKEIAEDYFSELIERGLIVQFAESTGSTKQTYYCKFNDLIHQMCTSKSAEENLVLRLGEGCGMKTMGRIRHLSVISDGNWKGGYNELENIVHPSSIRSLTVFGKWRPFFISEKMRMLRVLDLEGTSDLMDHHLEHIGKLLHLKYLSLRWCRYIFHLPHSLGNLRQLETLDIKYTSIVRLPKAITRIRKLQYIRAGAVGFIGNSSYQEMVEDMPQLMRNRLCMLTLFSAIYCVACCAPKIDKELTWEQDADANRRDLCTSWCCAVFPFVAWRLDARGVVVPSGFKKLSDLHTLATINIGQGKAAQDLGRFIQLRKLGVVGVRSENAEAFFLALSTLSNLDTLSVRSEGKPGSDGCLRLESDVLLCSPPQKLKSLKLEGKLVKLPGWINVLHNLVKLKLKKTNLSNLDDTIGAIGKLQSLKRLCLLEDSFKGEKLELSFHREAAFPNLVVLELLFIHGLESVNFEVGATSKLKLVHFVGYHSDVNAGMFSGLASLRSLKEFMLDNDDNYKEDFVKHVKDQLGQNSNNPVLRRF